MGLPMYKPRETKEEKHQAEEINDEDLWSIFPRQLFNNVHGTRRRPSSTTRDSISNHHHTQFSFLPSNDRSIHSNTSLQPRIRSRIARRHSMLTSSLLDRRRGSRVHQLPGTHSSTSPPMRSELDRRLQQRITEKEDLLEQLRVTVSLLDQFLSARAILGLDTLSLPSLITEDIPAVLESASWLAAMTPSALSSSTATTTLNASSETTALHEMVDRLLQIPPYSVRIQNIEHNIISAHRRIREQLVELGSTMPSLQPSSGVTRPELIFERMPARSSSSRRSSLIAENTANFVSGSHS